MPGTAAERLDDDLRTAREEVQQIKLSLARAEERLARLDASQIELKSTPTDLATLRTQMTSLISIGRWAGSIFGLATVYGVLAASNRLSIDETEIKGADSRIVSVETQQKTIGDRVNGLDDLSRRLEGRLTVVETEHRQLAQQLSDVRRVLSRRPPEAPADLDQQTERLVVGDAARIPPSQKLIP